MDGTFEERMRKGLAFERTRSGPPEGFPGLPAIAGGRYRNAEFLRLERKFLWQKSWLYACHMDQLPAPGNYVLLDRCGSSIVVVRGRDDGIRAFYNTCRHRGGPLVRSERGTVDGRFVCAYHGWTYDLKGRLMGMPDRADFVGLDRSCHGLEEVRCERLGDWVFLNENSAAPPLLDSLQPAAGILISAIGGGTRHVASRGFEVECNVKVLQEAFMEVYHLAFIHPQTVDRFLDYKGTSIRLWPRGHSVMVTPHKDPDWEDPGARGMPEFPGAGEFTQCHNVSLNLFPNLITPIAPTGIPFLVFWPLADERCQVDVHWFSPDWGEGERSALWDRRLENFERILDEDLQLAPHIQRSVASRGFRGIRLNYQERRIYHWHEELDRRIGPDRIPAALRIEPRLADWVEDADDESRAKTA